MANSMHNEIQNPSSSGSIIIAQAISYTYSLSGWSLQNISFELKSGEVLALTGPNGSGKTTLIKLLATLKRIKTGRLKIFGLDASRQRRLIRRKIAYLSQKSALANSLSARDNLFLAASFQGLNPHSAQARVDELIDIFALQSFERRIVGQLSGGQYRRVALARAFVGDPELLLLDEPTVGMDATSRESFHNFLKELAKGDSIAIVLASHDEVEVNYLADKQITLDNGVAVEPLRIARTRKSFKKNVVVSFFQPITPATVDYFTQQGREVRQLGKQTLEITLNSGRRLNSFLASLSSASDIAGIQTKVMQSGQKSNNGKEGK